MEAINIEDAISLAERNMSQVQKKGKRFFERHVEKWVREHLFVPYFITYEDNKRFIHIISLPEAEKKYEKIFFKKILIND